MMLKNYFKIAFRNIIKHRINSFINIGGLSVAIAAVVLIVAWVQNELSFDTYHTDSERIYLVKNYEKINKGEVLITENSPYALASAIDKEIPEVEMVTGASRSQRNELTLRINNVLFNEEWALYVDKNWFNVFQYEFLEGTPVSFFDHPQSLMITKSKAKQLFGTGHAAGKTILIDSMPFVVQAVVNDNPTNSSFRFDLILPVAARLNSSDRLAEANFWGNLTFKTFVKLRRSAAPEHTAEKITGLLAANRNDSTMWAALLPLTDLHFDNDLPWSAFEQGNIKSVKIFSLLAIVLLIIACINYVNLSVANVSARVKEMAVRKIMGANRYKLLLQLLTENALAGFIAMVMTMILVKVAEPYFNSVTGKGFHFTFFSFQFLITLIGTYCLVIFFTCLYPALLLASFKPVSLFKGVVLGVKNTVIRKFLVTSQFAMAVILIVAALVIYKQMAFVRQQTGYDRSLIFSVKIPGDKITLDPAKGQFVFRSPFKKELLSLNQVKNISQTSITSIINDTYSTAGGIDWPGKPPGFTPSYFFFGADADLNKIMKLELLSGRWFYQNQVADEKNVILNETAVKKFGLVEPVIGHAFDEGKIIGVVKDFHYRSMHKTIEPVVFRLRPDATENLLVEARPGNIAATLKAVERIWQKLFPDKVFSYSFLDEEFDKVYREDQQAMKLTLVFSGLSILLSCIGLLGLVIIVASQREKELAIRKVLGLGKIGIARLVSKDFLLTVMIAVLVGSPIAWLLMHEWLQDFAYRVDISVWNFVIAGCLIIFIAVLTVGYQSIKAAVANPAKSLRTE